jgi:hypothetical protein
MAINKWHGENALRLYNVFPSNFYPQDWAFSTLNLDLLPLLCLLHLLVGFLSILEKNFSLTTIHLY